MVRGNHVQALFRSDFGSVLAGLLEIVTKLDQFCALRTHGRILRFAVTKWDDDCHGHIEPLSGQRYRLPMIAAGGSDQSPNCFLALEKRVNMDDCRSRLECTDWRVVLVLDPNISSEPLIEQRP